jgi:hypothetical protein
MTPFHLRPLLIAVLQLPPYSTQAQRSQARVTLTIHSQTEGYALLEIFEVSGQPVKDDAAYAAIEDLAERTDAHALLLSGRVDNRRLAWIARAGQMTMLTMPTKL